MDFSILTLRRSTDNFSFRFQLGGDHVSVKYYGQVVSGGSDKPAVGGKLFPRGTWDQLPDYPYPF